MKSRRGFTLIETLLTLALIVVVGALMYSFFGQGLHLYTMETETAEEQANMRQVLSDITNRTRLTDPTAITYADGVLSIGTASYTYDSANQQILRNGTALATGVSAFSVSLSEQLLEISVTSTAGSVVSTSLSLRQGV